ncbi:hypothetical protein [Brevibacillus fulvus]|uniref:Uncharacterized protein n=1 Tax=Brevibacillus fulvus TaxID=1125967 RepID=A0A939BVY7_9BACL|nr:hypothetical protein [Brevibacillus fulvus]MBM7591226.1 hypothetical protein [Brevibacillus fulvus]
MRAAEVLEALRRYHGPAGREWAFFEELRAGTGYGPKSEQRFDAWAINLWPSKGMMRRCYEIKVSRSDFLHELRNPEKRQKGLELSNEFYFVTPAGLVDPNEIPEETGLIEVREMGCRIVKKAPYRTVTDPPLSFLATIARRAVEYEQTATELRKYIRNMEGAAHE